MLKYINFLKQNKLYVLRKEYEMLIILMGEYRGVKVP